MNKGFTLIELLVSMLIIGLLIALTIPSYMYVYNSTREANYKNKLNLVKQRAIDYGETIKDEIQSDKCRAILISDLIKKGYIKSDYTNKEALTNPMNNQELEDNLSLCYCKSDNQLRAYYTKDFNISNEYIKGDVVKYNDKTYECVSSYNYQNILTEMEVNQNKQKESRDPNTGEVSYVAADCRGYYNGELDLCLTKGTTINNNTVISNFFKEVEC